MILIGWPENAFEMVRSCHPPNTAFKAFDELPRSFLPLPTGISQTRLVAFVKGWSYIETDFSAARLRGFCGPIALPLAFSSDPDELSMDFDQVKAFVNWRPPERRRSSRT